MARKKCKIRYKRLLIFLLVIVVIVLFLMKLFSLKITNIYVSGNSYFSDQYILELAQLENYPNAVTSFSSSIESRISENDYIDKVKVSKKGITKVYIDVVENRPLFYDEIKGKTVLLDGSHTSDVFDVPILINGVDSDIYDEFLSSVSIIDSKVFEVISEFRYTPNDVDKELFLITMKDGNYIYVNLNKFDSINKYLDIVVNFNNYKGILYLDSGEYFKILDN